MDSSWFDKIAKRFFEEKIEEIYINGTKALGILKNGLHSFENSNFSSNDDMILALQEFSLNQGLRLDPLSPAAGGFHCESNLRWHCLIPPLVPEGPLFVVRKHNFASITMESFESDRGLTEQVLELVKKKSFLMICGETGCGKTSLLADLLKKTALEKRILILEELEELPLLGNLWSRLLSRKKSAAGTGEISLDTLFRESMRLRPDCLVFGELRGKEILTFYQALLTGHSGVIATIHASNIEDIKKRFAHFGLNSDSLRDINLWCLFLSRANPPKICSLDMIRSLA